MAKQTKCVIEFDNGMKMTFDDKAALNKHLRTNKLPSFKIVK